MADENGLLSHKEILIDVGRWATRGIERHEHPLHELAISLNNPDKFTGLVLDTVLILRGLYEYGFTNPPENTREYFDRKLKNKSDTEKLILSPIINSLNNPMCELGRLLTSPLLIELTIATFRDEHPLHKVALSICTKSFVEASDELVEEMKISGTLESVPGISHQLSALAGMRRYKPEIEAAQSMNQARKTGGDKTRINKKKEVKETQGRIKEAWNELKNTPEINRASKIAIRLNMSPQAVREHVKDMGLRTSKK